MKNEIKCLMVISLMMIFMGCGNGSKIEENFSGDDLKAVQITERSLPRGAKIEDCQVVKSKLPLALLETEYKSVRDKVNKARLDYRSCITRGLNEAANKNVETLVEIQNMILEKSKALESASTEYLFVLAKVKERSTNINGLYGYIAIFDSKTLEKVDIMQVTTPLFNNAVMLTEALDGTLSDPSAIYDSTSLNSNNPIVKFILGCNPK